MTKKPKQVSPRFNPFGRLLVIVNCADNIHTPAMRNLGELLVTEVRKGIEKLEEEGKIQKGQLLVGSPGYTLGMKQPTIT